jgi:hypothetical protein
MAGSLEHTASQPSPLTEMPRAHSRMPLAAARTRGQHSRHRRRPRRLHLSQCRGQQASPPVNWLSPRGAPPPVRSRRRARQPPGIANMRGRQEPKRESGAHEAATQTAGATPACAVISGGPRNTHSPSPTIRNRLRVRVEIMGSQQCGIVGKSQSVLMMIHPMISTRTRTTYVAQQRLGSCHAQVPRARGAAPRRVCAMQLLRSSITARSVGQCTGRRGSQQIWAAN